MDVGVYLIGQYTRDIDSQTLIIASERSSLSLQSDLCSSFLCLRSIADRLPSAQAASRVFLSLSTAKLDIKSLLSLIVETASHVRVSQI